MSSQDDLTTEQYKQLVLALTEQLKSAALQIAAQQAEIAALRQEISGGPGPGSTAAKEPPAWVKRNRPERPKTERKKRNCAFTRRRGEATRQVEHAASLCPDCGRTLEGGTLHHTREVIDLPQVTAEVVEHRIYTRYCGVCKRNVLCTGALKGEVVGKRRFGIGVMSFVAYLRTQARMPIGCIRTLLHSQFGLEISPGEVSELLAGVADLGAPVVETLLDDVRASPVVHADETGWREDGRNGYLWSFSTPDTRYFVRDASRGSSVVKGALGDDFKGVLVTDFYSAYSYYPGEHQRCWVHLLRDLRLLQEKHPTDESVARFIASVRDVFDRARAYDLENHSEPARRKARFAFQEELLAVARPFLKRPVAARVLAQRMERFASELFVFVEYEHTPPDNNPAERAIRPAVVKRKISGGTRTKRGSDTMAILHTLFATWQLRGHDALTCFRLLLTGRLDPHGNPA